MDDQVIRTEERPAPPPSVRAAQALALLALVAAFVGALGPAERLRTTYSWPPSTLPAGAPSSAWYTPLLLVHRRPESVSARIPCALPRALRGADDPVTVLATARYPERAGGLVVTRSGDRLTVGIGDTILARVRTREGGSGASECAHELRLAGGGWSLEGGPLGVARSGSLESLPNVNGLFSELDLGPGRGPSIDVTTTVHATRTTLRQTLAWIVAALSIVAAMLLISFDRMPKPPWFAAAALGRRAAAAARPVDGAVAAALLVWWVIAPTNFDDGWVQAREQMFASSGGFSNYYSQLATNLPLGYWLEWAHHWVAGATSALLVLRLPMLLCVAAAWVLCRWIVARVGASAAREDHVVLWALAAAFVAGAFAWEMTLRPEPVIALLVTGVAACVVRFLERDTVGPLAAAAVLVSLALTSHPAGVVSLAPLLVAAGALFAWARRGPAIASTLVPATGALLVLLATLGSDVTQRRSDFLLTRSYSDTGRDEIARYAFLATEPPVRRVAVALILLAALAFLLRRRREPAGLLDFPAPVALVGALLLVATPSKWVWHFGTLVAIGAVAVAAETLRLRAEAARPGARSSWPFLAVTVATLVAGWSWWTATRPWSPVDLRTLSWSSPVALDLASVLPILLLAGGLAIAFLRGNRTQLHGLAWRVASWTALVLAVPVLAFTAATLVSDTVRTSSWTLARQNLETIAGDPGCGLAEDLLVSLRGSARALTTEDTVQPGRVPEWVPPAPVASLPRFALAPAASGTASTPWFTLPAGRRVGMFATGAPAAEDRTWLDWGAQRGGRVDRLSSGEITNVRGQLAQDATWRFFAAGELPARDPRATMVRVRFDTDLAPGSALAFTVPVTYANARLAPLMSRVSSRTLVYPELLPYFPCTRLPVLSEGAVEVPQHVVTTSNSFFNSLAVIRRSEASPFFGVVDLYDIERVPVADTEDWPRSVLVFAVDRRIPGAMLAPPARTTVRS